jgi:dimethylhistidine N-methyltransferase
MTSPTFLQIPINPLGATATSPAQAIAHGLLKDQAEIAPKYFYDNLGSRLFEAITALDEYYPTRTESLIFERYGADIFGALPQNRPLIELGAGSCRKAERLLHWMQPSRFVGIEIAAEYLQEGLKRLHERYPDLPLYGLGYDFSEGLAIQHDLEELGTGPRDLFYPGSSIGNFEPDQALKLLVAMCTLSQEGSLVIGVDTVKEIETLEAAYDDELGVTAAFNLNVLKHVNRILGSDFSVEDWRHTALFNEEDSRIEMHLVARRRARVVWPGGERSFRENESILTEYSYKWGVDDFTQLLKEAGFALVESWTDASSWFAVYRAQVRKPA